MVIGTIALSIMAKTCVFLYIKESSKRFIVRQIYQKVFGHKRRVSSVAFSIRPVSVNYGDANVQNCIILVMGNAQYCCDILK